MLDLKEMYLGLITHMFTASANIIYFMLTNDVPTCTLSTQMTSIHSNG